MLWSRGDCPDPGLYSAHSGHTLKAESKEYLTFSRGYRHTRDTRHKPPPYTCVRPRAPIYSPPLPLSYVLLLDSTEYEEYKGVIGRKPRKIVTRRATCGCAWRCVPCAAAPILAAWRYGRILYANRCRRARQGDAGRDRRCVPGGVVARRRLLAVRLRPSPDGRGDASVRAADVLVWMAPDKNGSTADLFRDRPRAGEGARPHGGSARSSPRQFPDGSRGPTRQGGGCAPSQKVSSTAPFPPDAGSRPAPPARYARPGRYLAPGHTTRAEEAGRRRGPERSHVRRLIGAGRRRDPQRPAHTVNPCDSVPANPLILLCAGFPTVPIP